MHHRSIHPFEIVERARDMREYDKMMVKDIAERLGVAYWVVVDWVYYRTRVYG